MVGALTIRDWEHQHLLERLRSVPAQPWLWLAPSPVWLPEQAPPGRGMRLHRMPDGREWRGDLRCGLPLPLPAEAVNAIVIQHAEPADLAPLLAECARVLMPGGRLWMTVLNRYSPYRAHWQLQGARPVSVARTRVLLKRQGLRCHSIGHHGPLWSPSGGTAGTTLSALRALCVLEAEKRTEALIGPIKASQVGWRRPMAT
jgi:SAM-dependent methyltransferase